MANFCPKCGGKNNLDDKFCKNCGANLVNPVEAPKEGPKSEKSPARTASAPSKPFIVLIISSCIQLLFWGLLLYWIWYSYGCAVGKYPGTGDQACQWFYSIFSGNGDDKKKYTCVSTGCGNLWRCNGTYYSSEKQIKVDACFTLGNRPDKIYSSWSGICRQCP